MRRVPAGRGEPLWRLNKYLAAAGVCSRRGADLLIQEGRASVNGRVVTQLGVKIDPTRDTVFVDGKQVVLLDEPIYILFNKPRDCITTLRDEKGRTTVMEYVRVKQRVYPVGRLDRNTTGVLILTNDGEFANRLMHPRSEIQKTYRVTLSRALLAADARALERGVELSDGLTAPARVVGLPGEKNTVVGITIREGRNRQVHRMFEKLGYRVEKLDRVAFAGLTCEGLPRGRWRLLTKSELARLRRISQGEEAMP